MKIIQLSDPLQIAAQRMRDLGIGALPVCDGETPVGMVTDRDIAVRGVAAGLNPADALVCDVMSDDMLACNPTDTVGAARALLPALAAQQLCVAMTPRNSNQPAQPSRAMQGIRSGGSISSLGFQRHAAAHLCPVGPQG